MRRLPQRVALGTMHGKEAAIAPALAPLGIALVVPGGLDTDRFGTFTGEIARAGGMIEVARAKARAAIAATGLGTGLASEGAYGPDPALPFVARGVEVMLWRDEATGHEIVERLIDDAPCFDRAEVRDLAGAEAFLVRIGFPVTAVIVARAGEPAAPVAKGVRDPGHLRAAIAAAGPGPTILETDMRAHVNPRRMGMIATLAGTLAARLSVYCRGCGAPGWGRLRTEPGLPCAWCGGPTALASGAVHGCTACGLTEFNAREDGLREADPGACPSCNP
jgi:hypothetical protein